MDVINEEIRNSVVTVKASTSQPYIPRKSAGVKLTKSSVRYSRPLKSIACVEDYPPEHPIVVYFRGADVTPYQLFTDKFKMSNVKYDSETESFALQRSMRKSSQVTRFSVVDKPLAAKTKVSQISLNNVTNDKNLANFTETEEYKDLEDEIPSAMCLPVEPSKIMFPERIELVLEETDTITLFELPSKTVTKGTKEAEYVEKQNDIYEYLTTGKGKNRKKISTEAQTSELILKTRHTNAPRTERKNNYAFASVWDMFDSYEKENAAKNLQGELKEEMLALNKLYDSAQPLSAQHNIKDEVDIKIDKQRLLNAACIMERVLANNNFNVQQENYKGLLRYEADPLLLESYNYMLKSLWTFRYYKVNKKPVTVVCVNTKNSDILGVGYGKLKYTEDLSGNVCIWNIKNPTQPERYYEFETPITSMAFSYSNQNLLAVGFYNGDISILDITSYDRIILAKSSRKTSPSYQPVWQVKWFYDKEVSSGVEQVMAINYDGRIDTFIQTKTKDFICYPMMKLMQIDNTCKSMLEEKKCEDVDEIPLFKTAHCLTHCWHPTLPDIYFIGTSNGCIYKCSTNYLRTYVDMFIAHRGPVNGMQFSKFCEDIFVTCGSDWTVKLWKESIFIPLIVLMTDMNPVIDVKFSPTHSTIIVAISGTQIYMWDIKHKIDTASVVADLAPKFGTLTNIQFTQNGKNLIIADKNGKVHMRYILGIFPPHGNQGRILEEAIQNNLIVQPDLMAHMEKRKKIQKYL